MTKRKQTEILTLRQRQRPRPSSIKTIVATSETPSQRLRRAIELSEFCLTLREAQKRSR